MHANLLLALRAGGLAAGQADHACSLQDRVWWRREVLLLPDQTAWASPLLPLGLQVGWALRRTWWAQRSSCAAMAGKLAGMQNRGECCAGTAGIAGTAIHTPRSSAAPPSHSDYVTGAKIAVDGGGAVLPMLAGQNPEAYKPQADEGLSD